MNDREIQSNPLPNCPFCNNSGKYIYEELRDNIFGCPGEWDLKQNNLDYIVEFYFIYKYLGKRLNINLKTQK